MRRIALVLGVAVLAGLAVVPRRASGQGSAAESAYEPRGIGVLIGGGVTQYVRPQLRDFAGSGGYWEVRAVLGTRATLATELAYVGSTHGLTARSAGLITHAAEGALRLNVPTLLAARGLLLEPFSFMGLGWTRLGVTGEVRDDMVPHHFRVVTVPVGVGFALGHDGFFADARLAYRPILAGDKLAGLEAGATSVQSWSLGALAGFEF